MSTRAQVRAFRDEWAAETGEPLTLAAAEVLMDRQADARYEAQQGGGGIAAFVVCDLVSTPHPEQVACINPGDEDPAKHDDVLWERAGDVLPRDLDPDGLGPIPEDPADRYGTPEHEAWLIQMEREDDAFDGALRAEVRFDESGEG